LTPINLLHRIRQRIHPLAQGLHLLGRGHAQALQGLGDALLEDALQLVPLARGALAQAGGQVAHALGGLAQVLLGGVLGLALQGQALAHQGLEDLAAFLLRLGKGAQAGQPDLLGRLARHARQLVCGLGGVVFVLGWAWHGGSLTGFVGALWAAAAALP